MLESPYGKLLTTLVPPIGLVTAVGRLQRSSPQTFSAIFDNMSTQLKDDMAFSFAGIALAAAALSSGMKGYLDYLINMAQQVVETDTKDLAKARTNTELIPQAIRTREEKLQSSSCLAWNSSLLGLCVSRG